MVDDGLHHDAASPPVRPPRRPPAPGRDPIPLLDEHTVRLCVRPDEALAAVRRALESFASGRVNQPSPWHLGIPDVDGELHIKGAHISGDRSIGVKLATGFYRNPANGLPSAGGLSIVLSAETGAPQAVLADNGYLTDLRTGLAGAVAVDVLAPRHVETVTIIGTGTQARFQLQSLLMVRSPPRAIVVGRNVAAAERLAQVARAWSGWRVEVGSSIEAAIREADVVVTTTPSLSPLVHGEWLKPGVHITAIGADSPGKRELDGTVFERATLVAADDPAECRVRGELQHVDPTTVEVIALGDVIGGRRAGRTSPGDITVVDLIGIGAEDAAVAILAVRSLGL